ncbi:MAG: TetR family transcriptional regulator [Clostridia bacterium]|nr:TetR family transcriptional regulator [Clostridia bacterium]
MPSPTEKAIVASFLKLVAKRPFDKITVRDIVDDCGINRNTFYYYFQDIYAVLEEICQTAIDRLPAEGTIPEIFSMFFRVIAGFCVKYPRAARGLALSFGFEGMERYFAAELDRVFLGAVSRTAALSGLAPDRQRTATVFLRHAVLGFCLDLMRSQPKEAPVALQSAIDEMMQLFFESDAEQGLVSDMSKEKV